MSQTTLVDIIVLFLALIYIYVRSIDNHYNILYFIYIILYVVRRKQTSWNLIHNWLQFIRIIHILNVHVLHALWITAHMYMWVRVCVHMIVLTIYNFTHQFIHFIGGGSGGSGDLLSGLSGLLGKFSSICSRMCCSIYFFCFASSSFSHLAIGLLKGSS